MKSYCRTATADDAQAIASVLTACWPDDTADAGRIANLLRGVTAHCAHIALVDGHTAGFVCGFPTVSSDGQKRWEVDLLAVNTAFRGKGIARRLIEHSVDAGRTRGAVVARGLVHVDNPASARAFAAAGFAPQPDIVHLTISDVPVGVEGTPGRGWLLPVQTFTYHGIWLEREHTPSAFHAARRERDRLNLDIAGAVVPTAALSTALANGYLLVGDYRWWTIPTGR